MAAEVTLPATRGAIARRAFDRISTDPSLLAQLLDPSGVTRPSRHGEWNELSNVQLALIPTTSAWLPMAWGSYCGVEDPEMLAACLCWGAEVVAFWDTMLEFVVERRPQFGPAAWVLAGQHLAAGDCLQIGQGELAWDLSLRDVWFLHSRP